MPHLIPHRSETAQRPPAPIPQPAQSQATAPQQVHRWPRPWVGHLLARLLEWCGPQVQSKQQILWFRHQLATRPPVVRCGPPATAKQGLDAPEAPQTAARGLQKPRGRALLAL